MKGTLKIVFAAAAMTAMVACAKEDDNNGSGGVIATGPVIVNASSGAIGGEIIIKFRESASPAEGGTRTSEGGASHSGFSEIDRILNEAGTVSLERLFPPSGRFEERTRREGLHLWYYAKYDPSVPTRDMALRLAACSEIEIIEYSLEAVASDHTRETAQAGVGTRAAGESLRGEAFPFNESSRSQTMQWHYNNTGNVGTNQTRVGADANVYAAWQLATGNPDVIVAVVDQGVKYDHEDLADNMWINTAEKNGAEGVDDDGNGYVDDLHGFNFIINSGELTFSQELMHGTHVAGTVAAVNNNGTGVCGVAGGSGNGDGVRIMSCEILGESQTGSSEYAADNGAVICQNSWGYTAGTISDTDWSKGSYSALTRAIQYFNTYAGMDENGVQTGPMAGGIVVFAAGNDSSNENGYPAADPNVVSVAAMSYLATPALYTNYNKMVSLTAPGGDVSLSGTYGGVYSTSVAEDGSSAYESIQGTSMASPHVSGACALAISYYYGDQKRKGLTGEVLRQALLSSTQPIDRFCVGEYEMYRGKMGVGYLDTYKLLLNIDKTGGIPAQTIDAGESVSVDMEDYFLSTDVLTYTVSDPSIVEVSLSGGVMGIKGLKRGEATVVVSDGVAIRKPIEITVQ